MLESNPVDEDPVGDRPVGDHAVGDRHQSHLVGDGVTGVLARLPIHLIGCVLATRSTSFLMMEIVPPQCSKVASKVKQNVDLSPARCRVVR